MDLDELLTAFVNPTTTASDLTVERVILSLLVTFLISLFIFYIYKIVSINIFNFFISF